MTREQFDQYCADFIASYMEDSDQFETGLPRVSVRYICDTEGCPQASGWRTHDLSIPLDNVWRMWCAPCSSPIFQIDPQLSDDPDYRLNVYVLDENGNEVPWGSI